MTSNSFFPLRWLRNFTLAASICWIAILQIGCHSNEVANRQVPTTSPELVQSCLLCHSNREMQRGPVIAGLPAWYQEIQLRKFLDGTRGKNPKNRSEYLMGSGVTLIKTEEDLTAIASYFASLPATNHIKTNNGKTVTTYNGKNVTTYYGKTIETYNNDKTVETYNGKTVETYYGKTSRDKTSHGKTNHGKTNYDQPTHITSEVHFKAPASD